MVSYAIYSFLYAFTDKSRNTHTYVKHVHTVQATSGVRFLVSWPHKESEELVKTPDHIYTRRLPWRLAIPRGENGNTSCILRHNAVLSM